MAVTSEQCNKYLNPRKEKNFRVARRLSASQGIVILNEAYHFINNFCKIYQLNSYSHNYPANFKKLVTCFEW
jgi:hypothetical protein